MKKKKAARPAVKKPPQKGRAAGGRRKDVGTRERILQGARRVFSLHPYRAATTRMIAQAADIEHPLIHYHFGSKEALFEAVAEQMYEEFSQAHFACFQDLRYMPPRKGLSLYLDRLLDYCMKNPEPLQLVFLNMGHIGRLEEIPGYRYTRMHMDRVRRTFEERIKLRGSGPAIERFIHSFHTLVIALIGAKSCQAQVLGLDPEGRQYRDWVKTSLLEIFLPSLEALLFPPKDSDEG